ncbi:FUN34 transmembrane protein [Flagelloscypha sp. PMI_526]|nr:FUN34 transmembrane protein [Flagelloscypha sp. PMI_526]
MPSTIHDLEKAEPSHHACHCNHEPTNFSPPRASTTANPAPLQVGLFSFATTAFILSAYNARIEDVFTPNLVLGVSIWCGGIAQMIAGICQFPRGNTFGFTLYLSYGAFWLSFSSIYIPGSGILEAYGQDKIQFENALGIYLSGWFIVTCFFFVSTFRHDVMHSILFVILALTYLFLLLGAFLHSVALTRAAGVIGIVLAFNAYYIGISELLLSEKKPLVKIPVWHYKSALL